MPDYKLKWRNYLVAILIIALKGKACLFIKFLWLKFSPALSLTKLKRFESGSPV